MWTKAGGRYGRRWCGPRSGSDGGVEEQGRAERVRCSGVKRKPKRRTKRKGGQETEKINVRTKFFGRKKTRTGKESEDLKESLSTP